MTEADFISEIQDEITGSGSLPIVVNDREIQRVIKQATRWFYDNYETSVERDHYVIQKEVFNSEQFKKNRTIIMPDCVQSVTLFQEINGIGRLGNIDRDFAEDRLIASEIFLSSFHGDDLVMRTAQYQYFDLARAFFLEQIGYNFNRDTKKLTVTGRDPKFDVYAQVWTKIPVEKLYDDIYFMRWCTCQAKLSFARIVSTYKLALPGNVEIDADSLRSEANDELEKLKETIDKENVPDWFLLWH